MLTRAIPQSSGTVWFDVAVSVPFAIAIPLAVPVPVVPVAGWCVRMDVSFNQNAVWTTSWCIAVDGDFRGGTRGACGRGRVQRRHHDHHFAIIGGAVRRANAM